MSFLDFMFILSGMSPSAKILHHFFGALGVAFAIGGTILIISALNPQYKWTYKAKNTVGVNIPMFSFHTLVAFLFLVGAILLIIAGVQVGSLLWFLTVNGVIFTLLNVYGFIGNAYVVLLKLSHVSGAKKAGISESEYYDKFVAPTLKR